MKAPSFFVLIPGIGMFLVALFFIGYALVRRLGWKYLLLGGISWIVTVALKSLWSISFNPSIFQTLTGVLPDSLGKFFYFIYVGALTGIFEVGLVWLVLRYTRLRGTEWPKALAFGIGFGALEALLLGFSSIATSLTGLLAPEQLGNAVLEQLALANNILYGIAPVVERLATIFVHILSNALLFCAAKTKHIRWFWVAFVYKTGLDSVAAFSQFWGIDTVTRIWTIEGIVLIFGLIGWWFTRQMAQYYPTYLSGQE